MIAKVNKDFTPKNLMPSSYSGGPRWSVRELSFLGFKLEDFVDPKRGILQHSWRTRLGNKQRMYGPCTVLAETFGAQEVLQAQVQKESRKYRAFF